MQDRVGHSDIKPTMDVYGRIAGHMALAEEQAARLEALALRALPALATPKAMPEPTPGVGPDRAPAETPDPEHPIS